MHGAPGEESGDRKLIKKKKSALHRPDNKCKIDIKVSAVGGKEKWNCLCSNESWEHLRVKSGSSLWKGFSTSLCKALPKILEIPERVDVALEDEVQWGTWWLMN